MDFEKKLAELEKIVQQLEDRNVGLEKGIELYEQGLELAKECLRQLNEGKDKIKALQSEMSALFNGESTEDDE